MALKQKTVTTNPKPERKKKTSLSMRLPPETLEALRKIAEREHRSMTNLAEKILADYVSKASRHG